MKIETNSNEELVLTLTKEEIKNAFKNKYCYMEFRQNIIDLITCSIKLTNKQ